MTGQDHFSGNEQEAMQFLADKISTLTDTVASLIARSEVDSHVLAAIIASHPNAEDLRHRWSELSSAALSLMYLKSMGLAGTEKVREAAIQQTQYWTEVIGSI